MNIFNQLSNIVDKELEEFLKKGVYQMATKKTYQIVNTLKEMISEIDGQIGRIEDIRGDMEKKDQSTLSLNKILISLYSTKISLKNVVNILTGVK